MKKIDIFFNSPQKVLANILSGAAGIERPDSIIEKNNSSEWFKTSQIVITSSIF